jgi:NAD(P)-dependent dehydrogenase (short-subunit alcohol dehydrogenase family)
MSSIAARIRLHDGSTLLNSAFKTAAAIMTRGVAKELAFFGIFVKPIAPGIVFIVFHDIYTTAELLEKLISSMTWGRGATAERIAGLAFFQAPVQPSNSVAAEVIEVNDGVQMS